MMTSFIMNFHNELYNNTMNIGMSRSAKYISYKLNRTVKSDTGKALQIAQLPLLLL